MFCAANSSPSKNETKRVRGKYTLCSSCVTL